jgi:MGT family glycosyltransferase
MLSSTIDPTPATGKPPFGPGLSPARGPIGRLRDRFFASMGKRLWAKGLPALNAARAGQGLEPIADAFDTMRRSDRVVVLSPKAFDFPYEPWPNVVHAGPRLEDPAWAEEQPWEQPAGDGPLVLVGLSSTYQDQADTLRRIAAALGELPVRGLITTGLLVEPSEIPAPPNVTVVKSAPHGEVLKHASAVVTHAGHGTVMKALAHGVPMVCMPMGRDQNDVAQRVAVAGAGVRLKPSASPEKIAAAVSSILDDVAYRAGATRLQDAIAEDLQTDRAVEELEALASNSDAGRAPVGVVVAATD